jgi:hypothetical protein
MPCDFNKANSRSFSACNAANVWCSGIAPVRDGRTTDLCRHPYQRQFRDTGGEPGPAAPRAPGVAQQARYP